MDRKTHDWVLAEMLKPPAALKHWAAVRPQAADYRQPLTLAAVICPCLADHLNP